MVEHESINRHSVRHLVSLNSSKLGIEFWPKAGDLLIHRSNIPPGIISGYLFEEKLS